MDATQPSGPELVGKQDQPRFLLEFEPRVNAFVSNFATLIRRSPRIYTSPPFWSDIFIRSRLPRSGLAQSAAFHLLLVLALVSAPRIQLQHRAVTPSRAFEHTTITYYRVDDYLPAIKSRDEPAPAPVARAADPMIAKQQVRSLPPTPEGFKQRIISPEQVKLPAEQPLPNLVASSAALPAPPVTSAERFKRDVSLDRAAVVAPVSSDLSQALGKAVAIDRTAGPPSIADANAWKRIVLPEVARNAIAPAPRDSARDLKQLNITARPAVPPAAADVAVSTRTPALTLSLRTAIAPVASDASGQLARSVASAPLMKNAVPPPPSDVASNARSNNTALAGLATTAVAPPVSDASHPFASLGPATVANIAPPNAVAPAANENVPTSLQAMAESTIVLGLRPAEPNGPIEVPHGKLNGAFEAGPNGKAGASGAPELVAGGAGTGGHGSSTPSTPAGLEVAGNDQRSSMPVVVASAAPLPAVGSPVPLSPIVSAAAKKLFASVRRPHIDEMTPGGGLENGRVEDQVFHSHRYYQMALNMPNFNSTSGSWIIRFAEMEDGPATDELIPPIALVKVDPAYPIGLMRDGVEGVVTLYAIIHADGTVGAVRVLNSVDKRLDEYARAALSNWKFRPASRHGLAVELEAVVQIPFRARKLHF